MTTYMTTRLFEFVCIGTVAFLFIAFAVPVSAQTTPSIPLCEIQRGLTIGSVGEDVRCLQRYLNWSGHTVAISGSGAPGSETTYYGALTAAAVVRWQNANASTVLTPLGLFAGTGYWGQASFGQYVRLVRSSLGV
ncbi:MAG: peptidoglycan-binding domain-containing protein [Patescibacteria group bacterium]